MPTVIQEFSTAYTYKKNSNENGCLTIIFSHAGTIQTKMIGKMSLGLNLTDVKPSSEQTNHNIILTEVLKIEDEQQARASYIHRYIETQIARIKNDVGTEFNKSNIRKVLICIDCNIGYSSTKIFSAILDQNKKSLLLPILKNNFPYAEIKQLLVTAEVTIRDAASQAFDEALDHKDREIYCIEKGSDGKSKDGNTAKNIYWEFTKNYSVLTNNRSLANEKSSTTHLPISDSSTDALNQLNKNTLAETQPIPSNEPAIDINADHQDKDIRAAERTVTRNWFPRFFCGLCCHPHKIHNETTAISQQL